MEEIEQFQNDALVACDGAPTDVLRAIKTLVAYAREQKAEMVVDHVDSFLLVGNNSDESLELHLCLRAY
jgi:hypothetical protein